MTDFELHPNIAAVSHFITDWPLCRVLLMEDARYPWLMLVPRRPGLVEITEMTPDDRALLWQETERACRAVQAMPGTAKLNIGALGNVTAQLHVHVVGRYPGDPAWPGPVWGHSARWPYDEAQRADLIALVRTC